MFEFGAGEKSTAKENKVFISHEKLVKFNYLIFLDSRGLSIDSGSQSDTFLIKLKEYLGVNSLTYLAVSRPKYLTVFASLYNFLKNNTAYKFDWLITNLGFVDMTPKKKDNIEDILSQVRQFCESKCKTIEHDNYLLSDGSYEKLKSIEYPDEYTARISDLLSKRFKKTYFINTPTVSSNIGLKRERPSSFFNQLPKTNEMIESIRHLNVKCHSIIDIRNLTMTYDGVHFNKKGHSNIFEKIKTHIDM